jgi:hypothetical protein
MHGWTGSLHPYRPSAGRRREALRPARLLVTVMQLAQGLPDRQAADAVRARIDWT